MERDGRGKVNLSAPYCRESGIQRTKIVWRDFDMVDSTREATGSRQGTNGTSTVALIGVSLPLVLAAENSRYVCHNG